MKVRATALGFDGLHRRRPGDVFEFEGKPSAKWMEPVDDAAREAFKKAGFPVPDVPAPAAEEKTAGAGKGKGGKKGAPAAEEKTAGAGKAGSTGDREVI